MYEEAERQDEQAVLRQDRKYFSRIGNRYFMGSFLIPMIQIVALVFLYTWVPERMSDFSFIFLANMLLMYLLGMPLMILIIVCIRPQKVICRRRMSVGQLIVAFIMSYAMINIGNIAGNFLTAMIGSFIGTEVENSLVSVVNNTNLLMNFGLMVLCAPVLEEVIFRKILVDRIAVYGEGMAVFLSGLFFGLFHGNLNQFVYAFLLGMFFAFIYVKTGEIRYTIILHMLINFFGSIVSTWVLNTSGYEKMSGAYQNAPIGGMVLLAGYLLLLVGLTIAGVVLLIIYRKKFRLLPGERVIPKGKRFVTIMLNPGMLIFVLSNVAGILLQLMGGI